MYDPPAFVWALTLVGVAGIPALTCVVLYLGARRAGLGRDRAALLAGTAAAVLGGWAVSSAVIVGRPHGEAGQRPLWLPIAVVLAAILVLAASRLPLVARALAAPGAPERLLLPHTARVAGIVFLAMMGLGHLPALFAVPAGLGDIAVGVSAPFVARRLARGAGRRGALWFNALGIADLVVALSLGALAPHNDSISELPLVLIPMAAVPLLIVLHLLSLQRLVTAPRGPSVAALGSCL